MIASLFLASAVLVSSAQWIRIAVSDDNANLFEAQPSSVELTGSNVNDSAIHMMVRQTVVAERSVSFLRWSVPISTCITGYGPTSYVIISDPKREVRVMSYVKGGGTVASMISEQLCSALISAAGKLPSSKNSL